MVDWSRSDELPDYFGPLMSACRALLERQLERLPADADPPPFGLVRDGEQFKLVALRMADEGEKEGAAMFLAAFAQELGADEVAFVSSAWMSMRPDQRPSTDPSRVEVVMVLLESRQAHAQVLFPMERSDRVRIGRPRVSVFPIGGDEATFSGRFAGLLQREVAPEVTTAVRKMLHEGEAGPRPGPRLH